MLLKGSRGQNVDNLLNPAASITVHFESWTEKDTLSVDCKLLRWLYGISSDESAFSHGAFYWSYNSNVTFV